MNSDPGKVLPGPGVWASGHDFRSAMRRLASTVCLVCVNDNGKWHGMTATAVMSLSAEPPAIAVAINRNARINRLLNPWTGFSVSLLGEGQQDIASAFGGAVGPDERFALAEWACDQFGAPHLQGAVASLGCEVDQRFEYSTHSLIAAPVHGIRLGKGVRPLLYADGEYSRLSGGLEA